MSDFPWGDVEAAYVNGVKVWDRYEAPSWLPIETAPKNGTWVLLYGGQTDHEHYDIETTGSLNPAVVAKWADPFSREDGEAEWVYGFWDGAWYSRYQNPTHWMPLPDAPK